LKTVTTATSNELKQSYDVNTTARLIAEWNMNRYSPISVVRNTAAALEDGDADLYPISSIVLPHRPTSSGIVKARANSAARAGYSPDGYTSSGYKKTPGAARYVTASPDSKYKYWSSPNESAGGSVGPTFSNMTNTQPTVIYSNNTWTNKIFVRIENSYSFPTAWTVETTTDGTNWTTVSTNPTIASNGAVSLWRQANGSWGTTPYYDNPTQLRGVRITVTQMNRSKVYFNLIELGLRLESDLSAYMIDWEVNNSMSEYSFITPLGTASANDGSVTLANFDNRFSNDNPSSMYFGLIDKNVTMRLDLGITTDAYTATTKNYEWIRMFTMRTEDWNGKDLDVVSVPLKDDSVVLQAIKPNPTLLESKTVAEIIWTLLDGIGMTNYFVQVIDADATTLIPYFWTDGTETMWDIIQKLSQATQTAVYFDEYNVLQIKTRSTAYDLTATPVWQFDGVVNGTKLPDIVDLDKTNNFEANVVNVAYKDTKPADEVSGIAPMQSMWEPEGDVVLRAAPLVHSITTTSPSLRIDPSAAKTWPYAGLIQVEGEFIRYTAKGYSYYLANGTLTSKYIASNDEKIALDKLNPNLSYQNAFNGYLWTPVRGEFSSAPKAHTIDAAGYTTRLKTGNGTMNPWTGGWKAVSGKSIARITTNSTFKASTWYTVTHGSEFDSPPYYYGTRIRFPNEGYNGGLGGLVISAGGTGDAGYYIELCRTSLFSKYPTWRSSVNELSFYVRYADGTMKRLGANGNKGTIANIAPGVWYDLDVTVSYNASIPTFNIFLNGVLQMNVTVPSAMRPPTGNTGRWGVFTRGYTNAEFEYVYASSSNEAVNFDGTARYNRIDGGYQSDQVTSEWIYNTRNVIRMYRNKKTSVIQRYNQFFFDDFGATVHEVREFNVKYNVATDTGPALYSKIYFSNDSQVVCPEFIPNPFGAKFILANASRINAVVNGNDAVTYGPENAVDQKLMVYGRAIKVGEEKIKTTRNENAILRRGEVAVDFPSDFIQSEGEATNLGNWITLHWAGGQDEITIESFMNPLLQLGDLVTINHPLGNMAPTTHKYFVVEAKHTYSEGMESEFTLRRARI